MNGIAQRLHIGKLFICDNAARGITLGARVVPFDFPAVINIDVGPPVIAQPLFHVDAGAGLDFFRVYGQSPGIPAIPSERRSERNFVADHDAQFAHVGAKRVFRGDIHAILPCLAYASADNAGPRVERQLRRQA